MLEKSQGNIALDKSVFLGQKQTAVKFRTFCKEDNVESILSTELYPVLNAVKAQDGTVAFSGKVTAKLLVSEENGTVGGMSYTADFSDEFQSQTILADSVLRVDLSVLDFSTQADGAEVTVNAVINADIFAFEKKSLEFLAENNLQCKRETLPFGQVTALVDEVFPVTAELEIKDDIARVLSSQSSVVISSATLEQEVLAVSGEVFLSLVYVPTEGELPKTALLPFEFSQEIAVTATEGLPSLFSQVKATKIHLEVLEDQKTSVFSVETVISVKGQVLKETLQEVVTDCFSTTNAVTPLSVGAESTLFKGAFCQEADFSEMIEMGEADQESTFCGVFGWNLSVVGVVTVMQGVEVSFIASGNAIFKRKEGGFVSYRVEMPLENVLEIPSAEIGNIAQISLALKDATILFDCPQLRVDLKVCFCVGLYQNQSFSFVSDVTEGEALEENFGAIEVSLAFKGDSLWEVAKNLNMGVDDIIKLNPEISDPLQEDQKLLVYHRLPT